MHLSILNKNHYYDLMNVYRNTTYIYLYIYYIYIKYNYKEIYINK